VINKIQSRVNNNSTRLNLFTFVICLLVSTLHWIALPQPRIQLGSIDAYLYTSLSLDYKELLERFGTTYYASRVATIFPMALFYKAFGLDHGFILLRILVSAFTGFAFFNWLKSFWPCKPSLFFSIFLIISPWLTRELAWDYVTGFSACYCICAFGCLANAKNGFLPVIAGILFAAAVNTNFAAIPYVLSFLACFLFIKKLKKENYTNTIFSIFLGLLIFYIPASVIMWIKYPVWGPFFEWRSVETTIWLMKGGFKNWHRPVWEHLNAGSYYIFTPFLVCFSLTAIFFIRKPKNLHASLLVSGSFLICTCLVLLYLHFIKKGVVFYHFSFIYALPAAYMGAAQILDFGKYGDLNWKRYWPWLLVVATFIILHSSFGRTAIFKYKEINLILSLALLAMTPFLNYFRPGFIPAFLFILSLTFLPLSALPHQTLLLGSDQKKEQDAIRIATEVFKDIKTYAPHTKGKMAIWVPTPESPVIRCITAMHFWGYSLISLADKNGFPEVNADVAPKKLQGVRYLILVSDIGRDPIEQGLKNIFQATGETWVSKFEKRFVNKPYTVDMLIAEKQLPAPEKQKSQRNKGQKLLIQNMTPCFDGEGRFEKGRYVFKTDPRLWANSATLTITEKLPAGTPALAVKVLVERGQIQLYVLGDQKKRTMPASYIVSAGAEEEIIVHILAEHTTNPRLIISNANPDGASQGELVSVRLIKNPQVLIEP